MGGVAGVACGMCGVGWILIKGGQPSFFLWGGVWWGEVEVWECVGRLSAVARLPLRTLKFKHLFASSDVKNCKSAAISKCQKKL